IPEEDLLSEVLQQEKLARAAIISNSARSVNEAQRKHDKQTQTEHSHNEQLHRESDAEKKEKTPVTTQDKETQADTSDKIQKQVSQANAFKEVDGVMYRVVNRTGEITWLLDGGATHTIACTQTPLANEQTLAVPLRMESVTGHVHIDKIGNYKIGGLELTNVLRHPALRQNLLSVSQLSNEGFISIYDHC